MHLHLCKITMERMEGHRRTWSSEWVQRGTHGKEKLIMLLCWSRRFRSKTPRRIKQDVLYAMLGASFLWILIWFGSLVKLVPVDTSKASSNYHQGVDISQLPPVLSNRSHDSQPAQYHQFWSRLNDKTICICSSWVPELPENWPCRIDTSPSARTLVRRFEKGEGFQKVVILIHFGSKLFFQKVSRFLTLLLFWI